MLKFQKIILLFTGLFAAAILVNQFVHTGIWLYGGLFVILSSLLAYGSMNIGSGYYCNAYCKAETADKKIAITFDDGPDEKYTAEILKILKQHDIKAVFFCIGWKAEKNPLLVKEVDADGHVAASHSYSHHFFFDLFSRSKMTEDLHRAGAVLNNILGKKIKLFRPPYGVTNPPLARALDKFNYSVIGWSLKSKDTVLKEEDLLIRLQKRIRPGDIVLFHDTKAQTVAVLEKFIMFANENNFKFERADRLLKIEPYE